MTPQLWAQVIAIGAGLLVTIAVRFVLPALRKSEAQPKRRRSSRPWRRRSGGGAL